MEINKEQTVVSVTFDIDEVWTIYELLDYNKNDLNDRELTIYQCLKSQLND